MVHAYNEVKSLTRDRLFATPWTVAHQVPPSMEFSRQEYWSGLPFPSPGDLPDPGTESRSTMLQADFSLTEPPGLFVWGIRSKVGKGVMRVISLGVGLYLLFAVAGGAKVFDFLSFSCLLFWSCASLSTAPQKDTASCILSTVTHCQYTAVVIVKLAGGEHFHLVILSLSVGLCLLLWPPLVFLPWHSFLCPSLNEAERLEGAPFLRQDETLVKCFPLKTRPSL